MATLMIWDRFHPGTAGRQGPDGQLAAPGSARASKPPPGAAASVAPPSGASDAGRRAGPAACARLPRGR